MLILYQKVVIIIGIGTNLKRILAERKLKINELSQISGIPVNTLYSITKRDSNNISSSVLTSLATALNVSPFDLTIDTELLRSDLELFDEIEKKYGSNAIELLQDFDSLNQIGKRKACEYVSDLTEIPKYKTEDH